MTAHPVITRTQRSSRSVTSDFSFSREMIPALVPGWDGPALIREYRAQAWDEFQRIPMPTVKEEAWRRTDLRGIDPGRFALPSQAYAKRLPGASPRLLRPLVDQAHGGQLVLQPSGVQLHLDKALSDKGVIFTDLMTAERKHADILSRVMGKIVPSSEGRFAAMAAAFAQNGAFVYIPAGVKVESPLHSVLWGPGESLAYFSHLIVYLEEGASLTYVHEAASPGDVNKPSMHAGIVELHIGDEAELKFVELQSWGDHVWNFSHERARVNRNGTLDWIFGALGSHLTKNFSEIDLVGEGATGRMSGFYFTDGDQHLDHDTQQNHRAPHTTSDLLFKGALKGRSRSVWQGMIYVAPGAEKTDGYQANRNLVLSAQARADSIPGLEILADDVRCTHGATVGKIDQEPVFYLLSRGIPYADAERLIVEGFFDPIMQRIPFEGVRARFQKAIMNKMGSN